MKDDYQLPDDTDDLKLSMNAEDFDLNRDPDNIEDLSLDKLVPDDMPIEYDATKKKEDLSQFETGGRKYNPNEKDEYLDVDGDPFDTLTVNIEAYDREFPQAKTIFLNTNHCPGIKEALLEAGLIEDLRCKVQSGFYMYPVVRWLR